MSVIDTQALNYEYFNDIRDSDFDKRNLKTFREQVLPYLVLLITVVTCIIVTISVTGVLDRSEYDSVLGLKSINQLGVANRVAGESVDSIDYLKILNSLESYFDILQNKNSYKSLDTYTNGSSNFRTVYEKATDDVSVLFDKDDCYARSIREFGGLCDLIKINDILYSNGTYYCYAYIQYPSKLDIQQYIHTYSYSFTKEFNNYLPTEASIVKYMLDVLKDNILMCSSSEICIEFIEDNGNFVIKDDSFITDICDEAYTTSVERITKVLGSTLTNEDF